MLKIVVEVTAQALNISNCEFNSMKNSFKKRVRLESFSHLNLDYTNTVVATRQITVTPNYRCMCVWKCKCHCITKLETTVKINVCQVINQSSQLEAGFELNSILFEKGTKDENIQNYNYNFVKNMLLHHNKCLWWAMLLFLIMVLLGFCKAVLGICIHFVDKCGYDYVQPGQKYNETTKYRHFWVNLFFFILLPFLMWCKCFTPCEDDLLDLNSEWQCKTYNNRSKCKNTQYLKSPKRLNPNDFGRLYKDKSELSQVGDPSVHQPEHAPFISPDAVFPDASKKRNALSSPIHYMTAVKNTNEPYLIDSIAVP